MSKTLIKDEHLLMTSLNSLRNTHHGIANEKFPNIVEVMDADEPQYFQGDHIYSLEYQYTIAVIPFLFELFSVLPTTQP